MFAILGIVACKMLPANRTLRILGMPNRLFFGILGSILCVVVEFALNAIGALTWDYSWWNRGAPWLIILFGYLHFFMVSFYIHDLDSAKRQLGALGLIYGAVAAGVLVFGVGLGWL